MGNTIHWRTYNSTLQDRGKITFWLPEDLERIWYCTDVDGGRIYSDQAIETLITIRFKYGLALRETEGFVQSIFKLMKLELEVPDFSTLCRRMNKLTVSLNQSLAGKSLMHVVVDSTGLKVFGEGEWKVRTHGYSKRRTWRKLHLAVDESDNQILAVVLSTNDFKDNEIFPDLMSQIEEKKIGQVSGDGAYDDRKCFQWAEKRGILATFPPRRGAKITSHGNAQADPKTRDEHIREIRKMGRKGWKIANDYHRRSLAETAMYRFKTLLSDRLSSKVFEKQWAEVMIKVKILNKMETPTYCS